MISFQNTESEMLVGFIYSREVSFIRIIGNMTISVMQGIIVQMIL